MNLDGNSTEATTEVQMTFLMRLAEEIKLYHTSVCLYFGDLIISHQAFMKTMAIALPLLKKKEFECLTPCMWHITEGSTTAKTDEIFLLLFLSSQEECQPKFVSTDVRKVQLLFSSLIFNLLLRKARGTCVWDFSVEAFIFSFSEDCAGMKMCIDNVQLVWGEGIILSYHPKCPAPTGQIHRCVIQSDSRTCKEQKILQISEAWKVLEGIFIDVHEVVGFLNSSAKRKWNIREKYINILILKLCLSHDVVEQYAEIFFLTVEDWMISGSSLP